MALPLLKSHTHFSALHSARRTDLHGRCPATVRPAGRGSLKAKAFPFDVVPLMVTMVEHVDMQRDYVVHKSIWHLSDAAIKSVYTFFAVGGVCFFASMIALHGLGRLLLRVHEGKHANAVLDPFYDSEGYRGEGGDGTVHWYYDRQEELEASAREELLEEIEQRVGGLRERRKQARRSKSQSECV